MAVGLFSWLFGGSTESLPPEQAKSLQMLEYVARNTAEDMLKEHGIVPPFGIMLSADNELTTFYPNKDDCPDKTEIMKGMCTLVLEHLTTQFETASVNGLAVVTMLESGGTQGFACECEVSGFVRTTVFPYQASGKEWLIQPGIQFDFGDMLFKSHFPFLQKSK